MEVHKCPVCQEVATKRCGGCKDVLYCTKEHQKQHWWRHKADCKPYKMEVHKCPVCQEVATKCCGVCNDVFYCSKEHQKQHWRRHKADCKPYKVSKDTVVGRHLVATRDIKVGEVVVGESPLVRGPRINSPVVCLACLQPITPSNSSPCHKCGWPLCRKASCRQSKEHIPECEWTKFRKKGIEMNDDYSSHNPEYSIVTLLRLCYVRLHQPQLWARLSKLEAHMAERLHTFKYQVIDKFTVDYLKTFYRLPEGLTEDELLFMLGIIEVNAFEILAQAGVEYDAVYDVSSMIEHSCLPNCNRITTPDGQIIIRAGRPITKGEHLSICYTERYFGTTSRFKHLLACMYFACRCSRCTDNTEIGTYYSAVLCQNGECGGSMLPEDLRNLTDSSLWTCDRCRVTTTNVTVNGLLSCIRNDLRGLQFSDSTKVVAFVEKWESKLHKNHFYMTAVRIALVDLLDKKPQGIKGLDLHDLTFKMNMCRHLSCLLGVIAPAEPHAKAFYELGVHECYAEMASRLYSEGDKEKGDTAMLGAMLHLKEASLLASYQPGVEPMGPEVIFRRLLNDLIV